MKIIYRIRLFPFLVSALLLCTFAGAEELPMKSIDPKSVTIDDDLAKTLIVKDKKSAAKKVIEHYTAKGEQVTEVDVNVVQAVKIKKTIPGFANEGDTVWMVLRNNTAAKAIGLEFVNAINGKVIPNKPLENAKSVEQNAPSNGG
jgi:hypothetical protein